ncbi:MAG TPA: YceI family protein [Bryobacteraceae bacterium]|jgi:polyisoprenoid-binding protein YceI
MSARSTVYTISPSPDSTLAIETRTSGLAKRKHLFIFERFRGALIYDPEQPLDTALNLTVEAGSLVCRDDREKPGKRARLTQTVLREALGSDTHPELQLQSERFIAKPLRGFVVEGTLRFRGIDRAVKANIGFGTEKKNRLQIDADATVRLSDFGVPRPSSLFGLVRTNDEVVLHALIWGLASR